MDYELETASQLACLFPEKGYLACVLVGAEPILGMKSKAHGCTFGEYSERCVRSITCKEGIHSTQLVIFALAGMISA